MENQMETPRTVRKAIEHLSLASGHIEFCVELDAKTKYELREEIKKLEQKLIVSWAKSKVAA